MALNDETNTTFSSLGAGSTSGTISVDTSTGGDVAIFIDDGAGGAPADHTVIVERYSASEERWMEFGRTSTSGASQAQSYVDPQIPEEMRASVVNDSAGSAEFRVNVVSY